MSFSNYKKIKTKIKGRPGIFSLWVADTPKKRTKGLSGIRNLSGYLKSNRYGNVAFSILMNGFTDESSRYTEIQDKIINTILYD